LPHAPQDHELKHGKIAMEKDVIRTFVAPPKNPMQKRRECADPVTEKHQDSLAHLRQTISDAGHRKRRRIMTGFLHFLPLGVVVKASKLITTQKRPTSPAYKRGSP
jgi:hypothetical protein